MERIMTKNPDFLEMFRSAASSGNITLGECSFTKKEYIFRQGDEGSGVHIVISGLVKSSMLSENGKDTMVALFGPGEPMGELEFFLKEPMLCSVFALENVRTLYADHATMSRLLKVSAGLGSAFAGVLASRLKRSSLRMQTALVFPLEYNLLKAIITRFDSPFIEGSAIHKSELAEYLGGTERHLNRILRELAEQGVITLSGANITAVNKSKARSIIQAWV